MGRYSIRRMERRDHSKLAALHKHYLGTDRDNAFYEWKYWNNPAGPHMCVVAEDNETGEIVGQIGSIPTIFQFFGTQLRGYYECDIIIKAGPDRGKLFFRTYRKRADLVAQTKERILFFNYALTIPKTLKITTKLWKVREVDQIPKYIRVFKHEKYLRRKFGLPPVIAKVLGLPLNAFKNRSNPESEIRGFTIEKTAAFDESADRLWDRTKDCFNIWTVRNSAYLNWRYVHIPNFNNTIFVAKEGDEIRGYIVVISVQADMHQGYIQDFHFEKDRKDVGRALLKRAIDFVREENCATIVCWDFPHGIASPLLREFGFIFRPFTGRTLVLRPAVELSNPYDAVPFEDALKRENWNICKGDDDWEL